MIWKKSHAKKYLQMCLWKIKSKNYGQIPLEGGGQFFADNISMVFG